MARADLDVHFGRIDSMISEITKFVPSDAIGAGEFRADLAGLLVVTMAATYESCVKETLVNYAHRHHIAFGNYAANNYAKLNSRVSPKDLFGYTKMFDNAINVRFKDVFRKRKTEILTRTGRDIEKSYEQVLSWRHDFAHAGLRNTTVEEAATTHKFAKRVLYCFEEAFV